MLRSIYQIIFYTIDLAGVESRATQQYIPEDEGTNPHTGETLSMGKTQSLTCLSGIPAPDGWPWLESRLLPPDSEIFISSFY